MITNKLLKRSNNVESALIVGETPVRIIAKIYKESVCAEVPAQKKEIKKSSKEIINTNNADAIRPGASRGKTIRRKVWFKEAPRSNDASIKLTSSSANRAERTGITYPRPNKVCPAIRVKSPRGIEKNIKKLNKLTAITISGTKRLP